MKIAALLLNAVFALNSVDISLQGNTHASKCLGSLGRELSPSPSPPPSPPPRREPTPPRPRLPFLPTGTLIIGNFKFPRNFYYKKGHNNFEELYAYYEAVLNYERKIVGVFLQTYDNKLFGVYYMIGGPRAKINPGCIDQGPEHYDELDESGEHYYPEFKRFEKTPGIIFESLQAYEKVGKGLACAHTTRMRKWFDKFPKGTHIVRGLEFPQGFYFKTDQNSPLHPLEHHSCDVVVNPARMIIAVFLGPSEYRLHGIYLGLTGERVKLNKVSIDAEYYKLDDGEPDLYVEFIGYRKPEKLFRKSLDECV